MGDAGSQTTQVHLTPAPPDVNITLRSQEPHKQRRRSYDAAMNDRDVACGLKEAQQRSPSPPHGDRARYKSRRRSTDAEEQEMPGRGLGGLHAMTHGDVYGAAPESVMSCLLSSGKPRCMPIAPIAGCLPGGEVQARRALRAEE